MQALPNTLTPKLLQKNYRCGPSVAILKHCPVSPEKSPRSRRRGHSPKTPQIIGNYPLGPAGILW